MIYLVCFDIVEDRVRNRAVKILKGYGYRVQKSVFECPNLDERRFLRLKEKLDSCIDHTVDTVRFYFLCKGCLGKMEFIGIGDPPQKQLFKVV